jgi:opacity protein-like surface antigen
MATGAAAVGDDGRRVRSDELDHQCRPPENPLLPAQGGAGESVGEVPGDRADGVLQGPGGEPVRHSGLELSHAHERDRALEIDLRYTPRPNAVVRPYAGGGAGAHIINAESPFINDTFVESALDNISAGLAAFAGIDTAPAGRVSFGLQARLNLLSNLRYWSGRALVTYFFGNQPPSSPP